MLGNTYKLQSLLDDIVDSLNRRRFMATTGSVRSLMETAASNEHLARKDAGAFNAVAALSARTIAKSIKPEGQDETFGETVKALFDAQKALRIHIQLRRSNCVPFSGDMTELPKAAEQTNILTMIENRLRFSSTYSRVPPLDWYKMLCECVHPNHLSYSLFMDSVDVSDPAVRRVRLRSKPSNWTLTAVVLQMVTIPIIETVPQALTTLRVGRERWAKLTQLAASFRAYVKQR